MGMIFISYRRDDTADTCGRIYDRLVTAFGKAAIFMDVDAIPVGVRFPQYIAETILRTSVQLVVIGPHWLDATTDDGERRLDIPSDFVRQEIEAALRRGIPVIPILVQGATIPPAGGLPPSLRDLASHNAIPVRRNPDFDNDMRRLIDALARWVAPAPPGYAARPAAPAAGQVPAAGHSAPYGQRVGVGVAPQMYSGALAGARRPSTLGVVARWGVTFGVGYIVLAAFAGVGSSQGPRDVGTLAVIVESIIGLLASSLLAARQTGKYLAGFLAALLAGALSTLVLMWFYAVATGSTYEFGYILLFLATYIVIVGGIGALIGWGISPRRKKA